MKISRKCATILAIFFIVPLVRTIYGPNPIMFENWNMYGTGMPVCVVKFKRFNISEGVVSDDTDNQRIVRIIADSGYKVKFNESGKLLLTNLTEVKQLAKVVCKNFGRRAPASIRIDARCMTVERWGSELHVENVCDET